MKEKVRFLGLDVHAETIAVAVAEPDGEVRSLGTIPNRAESIRKMIRKLGTAEKLRACYEAGPTGYVVYWQLVELGVQCEVAARTLVQVKAGDRVKTDRRDAEKLARCYRSGDLTAVWIPDEGSEALRDLVRAREAAKQDQMRARHRLRKTVIDATNAFGVSPEELGGLLSSAFVAKAATGAKLVKGFNHLVAATLATDPIVEGGHRVVFLSRDDEDAIAPVAALAKQLGFASVKLGKLNEGGALVHARGRTWGQLIFQDLFKKEQ